MILSLSLVLTLFLGVSDLVSFDSLSHDFGPHPREDQTLTCDFSFTNISSKPVTVSYAVATCSCTKVSWSREPVAPGDAGTVKVLYEQVSTDASFEKFVSVFFEGESKPVVLRICGSFYDTDKSLAADYPVVENGLGLSRREYDLGYLHHGAVSSGSIAVANLTDGNLTVSFIDTSDALTVTPSSRLMYSKSTFSFRYSIDVASMGWGPVNFSAVPMVNGRPGTPVRFHGIITEDFSSLSPAEINAGPYPVLESRRVSFGTVSSGQSANAEIVVRNDSEKVLLVRSVFSDTEGIKFDAPAKILPGKSSRIDVKIPASSLVKGNNDVMVRMVSNSPAVPVLSLHVTGQVK